MQIDWERAINDIFIDRLSCPRCGQDQTEMIAGYSRKPSLNGFAPRHRNCPRGDECDARKLITLCEDCARAEVLPGTPVDAALAIETYMLDCRRDLEESLDFLADYWRDEYELSPEDLDHGLEDVDPEAFSDETQWRQRLEEEYLRYHREFRQRNRRVPGAGWRSEYVEEIRALGYDTLLGD
ncbi:MAG: hypothetical protein GEU80_07035 [Dehalococcoidia bacterium]|nr:hypothetical protein [Dehalococcoidia bacterium]